MIVKTTLAISAEHPNLPLDTAATFVGSAATFSITGVPTLPAISVAAVAVSVTNASGAVSTVAAVSGDDGWTATFPASHFAAAGTVKDGVVVAVSGTDENGAARTWTAGVGTIVILSSSPVPTPGDVVYNVRLFDAEPTTPTEGDLWPDGEGGYLIYQDGESHALGGSSITVDDELSETSENPVQNKVIATALETGYTAWAFSSVPTWDGSFTISEDVPGEFVLSCLDQSGEIVGDAYAEATDPVELNFTVVLVSGSLSVTATRTRITPKKTSQLTNDGDGTSNFATVAQLPTWNALKPTGGIPATDLASGVQTSIGKADTALQSGDIIAPSAATESGKAADALAVKTALALKADATSLPYALVSVTPTAGAPFVLAACFPIKYTEGGSTVEITADDANIGILDNGESGYTIEYNAETIFFCSAEGIYTDSVVDGLTFGTNEDTPYSSTQVLGFTPTYALTDRAMNPIVLDTLPENGIALAFPAAQTGKVRDFLVRLEIPAGEAPQIAYPSDVKFGNGAAEFPEINTTDTTGATAETILMFTETAPYVANATPAKFLVKGEAWNEIGGAQ